MVDKWKGVFKTIMFLISEQKEYLYVEKFDTIVNKINDICKPEYFQMEEVIERFTYFYKNTKITNSMLKKIEEIFQESKNIPEFMSEKEKGISQFLKKKS